MQRTEAFALLRSLFDAAVEAATPALCLAPHLARLQQPKGRTIVVGAGKASAAMAKAVEDALPWPLEGLVVTRYGHGVPCRRIEIVEAAHPVPDAKGRAAAGRILQAVRGLTRDDLVICLISGGGSALLTLPAEGLTLEDKQAVNRALLASGAPIGDMNTLRKHLSAIKGGRLALAAAPAPLVSYLISDVPGDDPSVIASGPTVPDRTTFADALAVLAKYRIEPPGAVRAHLDAGGAGRVAETMKPDDPRVQECETVMVATPLRSLERAGARAREAGFEPTILGDALEGLARDLGRAHADLACKHLAEGRRVALISGGETTVEVRGKGRGGRNVEYLLALAVALDGTAGISAIAGDTDGVDGAVETAGAMVAPDTLTRARAGGLDPRAMLDDNDAHSFFEALGDTVVTGPTLTNVNDFRAILVAPPTG
jgi:glycerate 2-kinase